MEDLEDERRQLERQMSKRKRKKSGEAVSKGWKSEDKRRQIPAVRDT